MGYVYAILGNLGILRKVVLKNNLAKLFHSPMSLTNCVE